MRFLPPSCRFPPLREGNPIGSVPPACRGNLKEGVGNFAYFRTPSGDKGKSGFFRGCWLRLHSVGGLEPPTPCWGERHIR
jgi:hypothetical protein